MKYFFLPVVLITAFLSCFTASAQITIDEVDSKSENVVFPTRLKSIPIDYEYFNRARYRAERAAIRKERNFLEISAGMFGTLTSYNDPWIDVAGGDNSIALTANFYLHHTFTKNLFFVETKVNANFGYNRMKIERTNAAGDKTNKGVWFKNQDEFAISVAPAFKMSKNWSYGATFAFRSQFANGYKSRSEQEDKDRKSRFMTPGYLDISLGVTYKCPKPKFPVSVTISPLALSATFAENDLVRSNGFTYGIEDPDKTSKYEGGSSVKVDLDRTFGKSQFLRYRTTFFSFYGWITDIGQKNKISKFSDFRDAYEKWEHPADGSEPNIKNKPRLPIHPTIRWENTLDIKATKYLSTTINFTLYYNRAQNYSVQTYTMLKVGLVYTFKNK